MSAHDELTSQDFREYTSIGSKQVSVAKPYQAPVTDLVGRDSELALITAAWLAGKEQLPLSPLLVGEPGVGKNRLVYELARRIGKPLYIFQGHEDVTAEDLACAVRFSDRPGVTMDYVVSPLVTAMALGGICFIDEIAKIRPRALALLVSVLDERRYIDSTLLGQRVVAREDFRFIAATNTADLEGNALPEFLRSRMRPVIRVGYPPREEVTRIVKTRCPRLDYGNSGDLIAMFWKLWDERFPQREPSPRDAIYAFELALNLADYDAIGVRQPFPIGQVGLAPAIELHHLQRAFTEIFRDCRTGE